MIDNGKKWISGSKIRAPEYKKLVAMWKKPGERGYRVPEAKTPFGIRCLDSESDENESH